MKHLLYCNRLKAWLFVTISMQAYLWRLFVSAFFLLYRFRFGITLYKRTCLKQTCSFVKPIWNEVSRAKDSILNVSWERNMNHYSLYGNWTVEPQYNDPLIKQTSCSEDQGEEMDALFPWDSTSKLAGFRRNVDDTGESSITSVGEETINYTTWGER